MLRILILLFMANMVTANHRDPYIYPIKPTSTIFTDKTITGPRTKSLPNLQKTYNLYTETPINRPIDTESDTRPEEKESYNKIPGIAAKPFHLNENEAMNNYDNYAAPVSTDYDLNLPFYPEKSDNIPAHDYILPNDRPRKYEGLQLSHLTEKTINEKQNYFPYARPDQNYGLPFPEETGKQVLLPYDRPDQLKLPVLTEKPVNDLLMNQAFLPNENPEQFYDVQPPVYTEKPINKLVIPNDRPYPFKPNVPILTEIPVYDTVKLSKDNLIKEKLVSLILSSKKDLEKHIQDIQNIHDTYKSGTMYKIGYLTSFINKANESLSKLFKSVQSNHHKWDSLRALDTYEEVKAESEFIQELLRLMLSFVKAKPKSPEDDQIMGPGQRADRPHIGISWSYYDDTMP